MISCIQHLGPQIIEAPSKITISDGCRVVINGEVQSDYWYVDNEGYVCHKKTLWDKAKKMKMTENEYCDKYGYMRVWGEKKFRYKYIIKN